MIVCGGRGGQSSDKDLIQPFSLQEGTGVCLNVLGVVCLLILESMKRVRREGGGSVAENGIRVNDQVGPRGAVHIKAIPAVTALTT